MGASMKDWDRQSSGPHKIKSVYSSLFLAIFALSSFKDWQNGCGPLYLHLCFVSDLTSQSARTHTNSHTHIDTHTHTNKHNTYIHTHLLTHIHPPPFLKRILIRSEGLLYTLSYD
jgi:hypothetical protein